LTGIPAHAIILLPGSERLKGEPGPVGRDKPVDKKGESLDWKTGNVQKNRAAERNGSWKVKKGSYQTLPGSIGKPQRRIEKNWPEAARNCL